MRHAITAFPNEIKQLLTQKRDFEGLCLDQCLQISGQPSQDGTLRAAPGGKERTGPRARRPLTGFIVVRLDPWGRSWCFWKVLSVLWQFQGSSNGACAPTCDFAICAIGHDLVGVFVSHFHNMQKAFLLLIAFASPGGVFKMMPL